MNEPTDVIHK